MSINLNANLYSLYGVDTKNVAQVANKFLNQQEAQPTVKAIDYSKFNRATLGIDLYSSRTSADIQKQVALTQAGLYAQSINVASLNSQAAMNLYSAAAVQKNVGLTQSINQSNELQAPVKLEQNKNTIELYNTQDKNSNSSNGFNPFRSSQEETAEENETTKNVNLFA